MACDYPILRSVSHGRRKQGAEWPAPPVKMWRGGCLLTPPYFKDKNPLLVPSVKKCKRLQEFPLKCAQILPQIASKDPQIFRYVPKGEGTPLTPLPRAVDRKCSPPPPLMGGG